MSISSGSKILASDVSGKIDTAGTGLSKSGTTLSLATCVTAGNAGPTANASPAHGGSFTVPYITYDAYGRITGRTNRTITLPAAGAAAATAYITTTWSSETSWYRKYSDGWIEQGGLAMNPSSNNIISLHTSFSNANYTVTIADHVYGDSNSGGHTTSPFIHSKTTTTFNIGTKSTYECDWYACGY